MNKIVTEINAAIVTVVALVLVASAIAVRQTRDYGDIAGAWQVDYDFTEAQTQELRLADDGVESLILSIYDVRLVDSVDFYFVAQTMDEHIAYTKRIIQKSDFNMETYRWHGNVSIVGRHYGYTELYVTLQAVDGTTSLASEQSQRRLRVAIWRAHAMDEHIFTYISAAVMLLMFINLGTVLDLNRISLIFCHPIGPLLGVINRYVLMSGLGLGLGYCLFPSDKSLQLALFYSALTPSGGLANVCSMFLKGNINLSIATTTLNSLLALAALPLWNLLLTHCIYNDTQLGVPFAQLAVGAIALLIALALGVVLRLSIPKTTRFIFRGLKPVTVLLSLCLIGLTVGMNAFAFEQFTWRVLVAAICLPIAGYILSHLLATLFRRTPTDALTLAVEASVLNMTLPIVLLQYSVAQPQLDLILIVPITAALVSLLLMLIFYVVRRISGWNVRRNTEAFDEREFLAKDVVAFN